MVEVHKGVSRRIDEDKIDGRKGHFIVTAGHLKLLGIQNSSLRIAYGEGPEDDGLISGRTRIFPFAVMLIPVLSSIRPI